METTIIIVAIVILILCIASKIMDIIVGLIGTIGGIALYAWLNSTDAIMTKLQLAFEYGINPNDLTTYCIIAIVVSVIILVVGLVRGKKVEKVVVVQQQVPIQNTDKKTVENKAQEVKTEEPKVETDKKGE